MISKIDGRELPAWYGVKDIGFVWHGAYSDPELEYQGVRVNLHDVEDTMWSYFQDETGSEDEDEFAKYVLENVQDVYDILNNVIENGGGVVPRGDYIHPLYFPVGWWN